MLPPDFLSRIGKSPSLISGRLHILDLDRLEMHFGARWPRVRGRALDVAEQLLLAGLGPSDLHYRASDTSWLMFFPTLDKATAQTRCALIADRIYRRLIGDEVKFSDLNIRTVVVETDGHTLLETADPVLLVQSALDGLELREIPEVPEAPHHW